MDCDMHHTVSCLSSTAIIFTTCQIFPLFQCGCTYSIVCQRRGCRDTSSWARGRELARFGRFCWFDFACCSWILHDCALKGEFCRWSMLSTKKRSVCVRGISFSFTDLLVWTHLFLTLMMSELFKCHWKCSRTLEFQKLTFELKRMCWLWH